MPSMEARYGTLDRIAYPKKSGYAAVAARRPSWGVIRFGLPAAKRLSTFSASQLLQRGAAAAGSRPFACRSKFTDASI